MTDPDRCAEHRPITRRVPPAWNALREEQADQILTGLQKLLTTDARSLSVLQINPEKVLVHCAGITAEGVNLRDALAQLIVASGVEL
jgi:hypothetical protein